MKTSRKVALAPFQKEISTAVKKKCVLFIVLCALLFPLLGQADNMKSIRQLREQIQQKRWTQSYQTKWREVTVDVAPYVPQAEFFPVLKLMPDYSIPDVSSLTGEWTSRIPHGIAFNIS